MADKQPLSTIEGHGIAVVGAGSGIGRGAALLLASRGASVACIDWSESAATATAQDINESGGDAIGYEADVRNPASIDQAFDGLEAHVGQLHGVINSAGITGPTGLRSHEFALEDFDATYEINLRGTLIVSQAAVRRMLPHGYGRIVHLSSIAGKEGNPNMIGYSATKAGVIGMVKALGKEYAADGITINALAPAVIRTPLNEGVTQEVMDYMIARIPIGRVGTVEEVAEMLSWIVSPECSFTTGFTFDISGGRATY